MSLIQVGEVGINKKTPQIHPCPSWRFGWVHLVSFCVVIIGVTVAVFEGMLMLIIHWTLHSLLRWFQLKNPYARCQDGYSAAPLGAPWKLLSAIKSSKFKKMPNTTFLPNESTLLGQSLDLKSHGLLLRKHPATSHPSNKLKGNILQKPFLRSFGSALACCTMSMFWCGPPKNRTEGHMEWWNRNLQVASST